MQHLSEMVVSKDKYVVCKSESPSTPTRIATATHSIQNFDWTYSGVLSTRHSTMPDAFFATSKKRKRSVSKGSVRPSSSKPAKLARTSNGRAKPAAGTKPRKKALDEELESDQTDEGNGDVDDIDLRASDGDPGASGSEDEDETPAEKRLRLAKLYLESVKEGLAEGEFDAAEVDKELLSARLKQDVMEHAGKVHLFVADSVSLWYNHALLTGLNSSAFHVSSTLRTHPQRQHYAYAGTDSPQPRRSHPTPVRRSSLPAKKGRSSSGTCERARGSHSSPNRSRALKARSERGVPT